MKQNERKQKRENFLQEDFDLGRFFELATTKQINVNRLILHEIESEILEEYTIDFELIGCMLIGEIDKKQLC